MKILFSYFLLMLYLHSIIIIEALSMKEQNELLASAINYHVKCRVVLNENYTLVENGIEFWHGKCGDREVLVRVPEELPGYDVFQDEAVMHEAFHKQLHNSEPLVYFAENISVSFSKGSILYLHALENIDAHYEHARSMITLYQGSHLHGYTCNGRDTALSYDIAKQPSNRLGKLRFIHYHYMEHTSAGTRNTEKEKLDLMKIATNLENSVQGVSTKTSFIYKILKWTSKFKTEKLDVFLERVNELRGLVAKAILLNRAAYDSFRKIFEIPGVIRKMLNKLS